MRAKACPGCLGSDTSVGGSMAFKRLPVARWSRVWVSAWLFMLRIYGGAGACGQAGNRLPGQYISTRGCLAMVRSPQNHHG